jgi:imidazolonepropionase-like amidohydrolase
MQTPMQGTDFPPRLTGPLAITHVTVVPMDTERLLPDHTVVLEDGRIRTLAPSGSVDVTRTPGARVVDGTGKYLLPGLADMHVHYWDPEAAALYLANGVTLVRNMWGAPFHLALRRQVQEGRLPGPRIVTTTPIIDGPDQRGRTLWPGATLLDDPAQAAPLVRRYAARGYEQVKVLGQVTPDALRALGGAARAVGQRLTGHCPNAMAYEEAIDAGMACFEHLSGIWQGHLRAGAGLPDARVPAGLNRLETLRWTNQHGDLEAIRRLAQRMAAEQIWNCPTLVAQQQSSQRQEDALRDPHLKYVPPISIKAWHPANNFRTRNQPFPWEAFVAARQAANRHLLQVIGILRHEGAPLLLGTDTPNPYVVEGFSLHQELANFVAAGLTPFEAIRCGTAAAARFVQQEREWGTIAPGRRADLLLVSANPLADVAALRHPDAVFVNGFAFSRADLDRLLAGRERAVQAPPAFTVGVQDLDPTGEGAGAIPAGAGRGRLVAQGVLREVVAGAETGKLAYRHEALAGGGWLIRELYQAAVPAAFTRRASWWLAPDLAVRRGGYRHQTSVGAEVCEVAAGDDGATAVTLTDVDGWQTRARLDGQLAPGDLLALTLPALAPAAPGVRPALTIALGEVRPGTMALACADTPSGDTVAAGTVAPESGAAVPAVPAGERIVELRLDRPGQRLEQTFRIGSDGHVLAIAQLVGIGRREFTPVSERRAGSVHG